MVMVVRPRESSRQRRLDGVLALVVKRARGLVQNEDARVAQEHARDGDALLLTAGKGVASLSHNGGVTVGKVAHEFVHLAPFVRRRAPLRASRLAFRTGCCPLWCR